MKEYYDNHKGVVDQAAVKVQKDLEDDWVEPEPIKETQKAKARTTAKPKAEDDWVEDDDGNFVKKGD